MFRFIDIIETDLLCGGTHRDDCYWTLIVYECALRFANTRYEIGDVIETDLLCGDRTEMIVIGHGSFMNVRYASLTHATNFAITLPQRHFPNNQLT